ncbi:MAG: hypothetical protein HF974_10795 [ANME-2 cluster archaeon]|nr:hypothetical protein [ANME-2 cluster archaeon]
MIFQRLLMLVFLAVAMCVMSAGVGAAAVITVDDSGGADYTTIQAAVNNAVSGDVIQVAAGTYYEHVVVNKPVTLQGGSNSTMIIDGSGSENVVEVTVDGVMIDGFMIQNGSSGIYVTSSNNVFSNNSITNIIGANGISGGAGGNGSGIYLSGSTNNTLTSNTISNITGGTGGGAEDIGGIGGVGSGIYLPGSTNNTLTSNTISNITGGTGGGAGDACYIVGSIGGIGGIGSGIYLSGSTNNTLTSNTISNITGGTGGASGVIGSFGGSGGIGGIGSGIYLSGSTNNTLTSNTINNITGGTGGTGGYFGLGGAGDIGSGIYLSGSTTNSLTSNIISNITGGTGGEGFYAGGAGDIGSGIYLSYSTNNTLTSNTINNITGGTGGYGTYAPGAGGLGSGIYLSGSSNNTLTSNTISNTTGGSGGSIQLAIGSGGAGGLGSGIYLSGSSNNTLTSNIISNITGGLGGMGGYEGVDGTDGTGYSIYLYTSTLNLLFHNNLQNADKNGYDDGSNLWDDGYPSGGNYWSDYIGIDANTDGIGDTPYNNISGSAGAQDRYPLMEPWNEDNISIQLNSGWNLISLSLMPEDTSITSLLSPINGNYSIVWEYNANDTADHWKKYDPGVPFGNDLTNMEPGKGYWIMMTSDNTLPISGTVPESTDIVLKTGWNLIGYNSLDSQPVAKALSSISGNYSIVWTYNASDTTDHWKKYDSGVPFGNDLINMEPGRGYWIMMTSEGILKI